MTQRPTFLVTVDTEGDDGWARSANISTENVRFLPRFQALCERFGLKPTYLTNFEMASDRRFVDFASDALRRGAAEVGMHLHAWSSPPEHNLTGQDSRYLPYLIEYPTAVLRAKVRNLTAKLEDIFGTKMVSHRAGRWAMDERYAEILIEEGYLVDCSVTPFVSWRSSGGAPGGVGGTDYRAFPRGAYFVDPQNISREGASPLLEVPMTILPRRRWNSRWFPAAAYAWSLSAQVLGRLAPSDWLRPMRDNRLRMAAVLERAREQNHDYVEFMTHSSELMPGGGPYFPDAESIERLYSGLEAIFSDARNYFVGQTLSEYREKFS